jgi:integral membrane protein (TIGR00529 family)
LTKFILRQFPLTLIALGLGFLLILRRNKNGEYRINLSRGKKFVWEISPILLVITLILLLRLGANLSQNLALLISLLISIVWVGFMNRISFNKMLKVIFDKANLSMFILGIGIMVFKGILTESQALEGIKEDLYSYNIPWLLVIMFLPFFSGLVTGITVGFVGTSFPLVISLLPGDPKAYLHYVTLAYGCGYLGVLLSPVHICLILTRDYFKVSLLGIYRKILLPLLLLFGGLIILFLLYGGL